MTSKQEHTILPYLVKGLLISCLLIFGHILISGNISDHKPKQITIEAVDESPADDESGEMKLSRATYSIHSIVHITINRATAWLSEIIFCPDVPTNHIKYRIPTPLLGYLTTLLTHSISMNAP